MGNVRRLLILLALVGGAAACEKSETTTTSTWHHPFEAVCDAFVQRFAECVPGVNQLHADTLAQMRTSCAVSLAYERAPTDAPRNMAERDKRIFEECTPLTACDEIVACLDRGGCRFILVGPDDTTPEFSCGW